VAAAPVAGDQETTMNVLGLDNVFVPVGDLERAVTFYTEIVGLSVAKRFDAMGTVLFAIGDEVPGLGISVTEQPVGTGHKVWLEVPDARAAAAELAASGVVPLAPPFSIPTGWAFEIEDPWGTVIGFTDYVHRPELGRSAGREVE
jgi:predicted enzyme related to lactoylglutathione lyase